MWILLVVFIAREGIAVERFRFDTKKGCEEYVELITKDEDWVGYSSPLVEARCVPGPYSFERYPEDFNR